MSGLSELFCYRRSAKARRAAGVSSCLDHPARTVTFRRPAGPKGLTRGSDIRSKL